jgi:8-oxo-dGTP pyrophosphatase MutT (NUDIX family)
MGESLEKTLKREALEESGLKIAVKKLMPHCICKNWNLPDYFQHTLVFCYDCRKISGKLICRDHKIKELRWAKPEEALKADLIFSARIFLKMYLEEKVVK